MATANDSEKRRVLTQRAEREAMVRELETIYDSFQQGPGDYADWKVFNLNYITRV